MAIEYEERYAIGPNEVKLLDTGGLRKEFHIPGLMKPDTISCIYSHYDRYIAGSAVPVQRDLKLETIDPLKSTCFLERRELGIINIGSEGIVTVDGASHHIGYLEALYLGKGSRDVFFSSADKNKPARFYWNSAPAHHSYPAKKISRARAERVELGSPETANARTVNKLIVNSLVETCQLQMGLTELKPGSVWNTMPPHTHNRRMEIYFYFEIPEGQAVSHFMGQPNETRHLWMKNEEAVISPPWSIHAGSGTSNYKFIWGMAGENLDYGDMDVCRIIDLK